MNWFRGEDQFFMLSDEDFGIDPEDNGPIDYNDLNPCWEGDHGPITAQGFKGWG